jgi:hypothetical protein
MNIFIVLKIHRQNTEMNNPPTRKGLFIERLTHCETMFLFQFNRIMSENRKEQKLSIALIHSALINHTALIMCQRNFYNGVSRGLLKLEDKTSEQGWDTLRKGKLFEHGMDSIYIVDRTSKGESYLNM